MFPGAAWGARRLAIWLGVGFIAASGAFGAELKLITLDPGHFHAALFQREMLPGIADESFIYAPPGPDLTAHLNRLAQFNLRQENPAHWRLRAYSGSDFLERMLSEKPGQIVVLSGRNHGKVNRILDCARAGLHVLADKPWIIEPGDFPKLEKALSTAEARRVIVFDAMTQRFEITAIVQRALVRDILVFGRPLIGSLAEPAVNLESLHHLLKDVDGVPNLRPAWFFDITEQGEGLTDVGTHLADMAAWISAPEQSISCQNEIQVLRGERWPTCLSLVEFQRVTGEKEFPASLQSALKNGRLDYFGNNTVNYTLRGMHVRLKVTWEFAAPPGRKDTELASFRGSRSRVEVRQGPEEQYRPEVYVVPNAETNQEEVLAALKKRLTALEKDSPGLTVEAQAGRFHVVIPDHLRVNHEAHFALLAQRFLEYVRHPQKLPAWEHSHLLAKYFVTTRGVELARENPVKP